MEDRKNGRWTIAECRLQDANCKLDPSARSGRIFQPRSGDLGDQRAVEGLLLSRSVLGRIWEKPVDVAAIVTNQTIRRYVCPVEFEEGGKGSV